MGRITPKARRGTLSTKRTGSGRDYAGGAGSGAALGGAAEIRPAEKYG
jgi:hypothetical protein